MSMRLKRSKMSVRLISLTPNGVFVITVLDVVVINHLFNCYAAGQETWDGIGSGIAANGGNMQVLTSHEVSIEDCGGVHVVFPDHLKFLIGDVIPQLNKKVLLCRVHDFIPISRYKDHILRVSDGVESKIGMKKSSAPVL